MWKRDAGWPSVLLVAAMSLGGPLGAVAQTSTLEPKGVYSPDSALQSPPLRVEVLDGRRFRDIETQSVYRLYGLDTCAPGQIAHLGRQPWPCGTMATAWLVTATLNKWVACNTLREDGGEHLARCASADHPDIGGDMIREGIALASSPTNRDPAIRAYAAAEAAAREAYRGLWASSFQMPWEFRASAARHADATSSEVRP
jgi:endonuclease YncB( thermonuclease family)